MLLLFGVFCSYAPSLRCFLPAMLLLFGVFVQLCCLYV
ncbi:hypothetical protein C1A50_0910 [Paenibacillus polymyxa]|nr:hypothetical protein C1A50_0910 [Paenibacillus polymyxa]